MGRFSRSYTKGRTNSSSYNITTGMAFLSEDDILVLEKNNGTVQE